jgi:hypothetical protein
VQVDDAAIILAPRLVSFGNEIPSIAGRPGGAGGERNRKTVAIEINLWQRESPKTVRWSEVQTAFIGFGLCLDVPGNLSVLDSEVARAPWTLTQEADKVRLEWSTSAGKLGLTASRRIAETATQNLVFQEKLNGKDVPLVRLSEQRLAPVHK